MKKHVKLYLDSMGFDAEWAVPCECCGAWRACDIHHIDARGMGGSKTKDTIENLMAVCRKCHDQYGDKKQWKDWLKLVHKNHMQQRGVICTSMN
jgi:5-methylcytosine-specific restriction endonuclease McrA